MSHTEESILKAAQDNCFFKTIYKEYRNEKEIGTLLADMHNQGKLNLIAEYNNLHNSDEGQRFYTLRNIFDKALPTINAPIQGVIKCVKHIITEAGNGMSASWVKSSFAEFCQTKPERIHEVISLELAHIDDKIDLLSTALISGSKVDLSEYAKQAMDLTKHENIIISTRAIFSLGRVDYRTNEELKQAATMAIFEVTEKQTTDENISTALQSLYSILGKNPSEKQKLISFIQENTTSEKVLFIHTATEILSREKENIPEDIESALLKASILVAPKNKGSIENIDHYLQYKISNGKSDTAIKTLESIFENTNFEISINNFDGVRRYLIENRDGSLSKLITRWLLFKKVLYGRACFDILKACTDGGIDIQFDTTQLNGKYKNHEPFLAKKACGWFFSQQSSAISLIVSLVEKCTDEQADSIRDITFNPLLISYPGSVKKYLLKHKESTNTQISKFCSSLLEKLNKYHEDIDSSFSIKELRPSNEHKFTYNKHHQAIMNNTMREGRKKSFLSGLFSESVLLYGKKSINYIYHGDERSRQEMPLQSITHSIEFPSLEYIDPHNLNEKLRWFRIEGCEQ